MTPVSTHNSEHYTWGGACDGWRLVRHDALSVIEERMPPGASELEHYHARARQFFYVLEGTVSFSLAGEIVHVAPRHGLEIAPGVRHRAFNAGAVPAVFVLTSAPSTAGDRINLPAG